MHEYLIKVVNFRSGYNFGSHGPVSDVDTARRLAAA
jgi:hypothetical protein